MKSGFLPFAALFAFATAALHANPGAPQVSNVVVSNRTAGIATVTFDLDEDAVVTAEFIADGVTIPAEIVQTLTGDINRKVSAGAGRSFTWKAYADWPDHVVTAFSVRVTAWPPLAPPDYMAVDLRTDAETPRIRYFASSNAVPGGVTDRRYKSDYLLMRRIPAAMVRHRQGSPTTAPVRGGNETAHYCTLSEDYYMAVYEFTEAQFALVGGSRAKTITFDVTAGEEAQYYPLSGVYYQDNIRGDGNGSVARTASPKANSIIGKLRTRSGIDTFDLPTDAQWEYACRAGTDTTLNDGTESGYGGNTAAGYERAKALAWFTGCANGHPHEVGLKKPNAWGLYDMLGNMREWCRDGNAAYANDADVADPVLSGNFIMRGGCWNDGTYNCTSSARNDSHAGWSGEQNNGPKYYGFRVMCAIPAER